MNAIMNRAAVIAALLAGVAVTAGCTDIVGSADPQPSIRAQLVGEGGSPQPFQPTGAARVFRLRGHIDTSSRCQEMRARLDGFSESDGESSGVIELAVEATSIENCPNPEPATWNYNLSLTGVAAGEYSVTVEHRFVNSDKASNVVFDDQVVVGS